VRTSAVTEGVRLSDVVLTGVLLAVSVIQVLTVMPLTGGLMLDLALTVCWVLPLLWRRTHPVAAVVAATATYWVPVDAFLFVGFVVALLLFYSLGRWTRTIRAGLLACAFALVMSTAGTLLGPEDPVPAVLSAWLVVLAPYGFGLLMRTQEREAEDRLRAEREAVRRRAVEEERARIVRELHDVVGHEVTLMSIQSEAAAQALARAPDRAAEPIEAVRETAHRANRELRAMLEVLGEGELTVVADERGLAELTDRAARLGIPCDLQMTGQPWRDAPQQWLAVNRIAQECLTNAGKHAPGERVDLRVEWSPDAVRLHSSNAAPAGATPGNGLGLPGMAERARLLGGTLEASYDDGRFVVSACLPAPDGAPA
jgi:signal transduction histidine kinase